MAALRKVAREVEREGLSHRPTPMELAALSAMVDARLGKGSGKTMVFLASLQDKSNKRAPDMDKVACKAGCYYCCDVYVSAQAPPIFTIADWLRANRTDIGAEIARLEEAAAAIRGKDADGRAGIRLACPFLDDGYCGIYPVRPAGCRGFFSLSLDSCLAGARGEGEEIPTPAHIQQLRGGYEQALSAVLYHWRLPTTHYELTDGLLVALKEPEAEQRWFDGENIFADVAMDRADESVDPEIKRLEGEFWQALWAVAHGEPATGHFAEVFSL